MNKGRTGRRARGRALLEQGFQRFERLLPDGLCRFVHWVRSPAGRWVRWPLAILFILSGFLWFLPVLGIWMLPLGLFLIAQDVPFLQGPVGRFMIWFADRWEALRKRIRRNARRPLPHRNT